MGGRGASSGLSDDLKKYGTEYHSLFTSGNMKFIIQNEDSSQTAPMETMTKGRVYVFIDKYKNTPKSIVYFDKNNKRNKQVDLDHEHKKMKPHVHHGYNHSEFEVSKKGGTNLTKRELKMVDRVNDEWYNYLKKRKE
ncbi:TPA: hypothetical protein U4W96_000168 [Streptococcus agalactiae]|uniref:hypothetical protein n=1 Tax=Streptococcus agalactiae TaxID=1311 RepID=UPI000D6F1194|nr:hypothetical protein [Streptococcus agalactiae]PWT25398.1 hypothetical protein CUZ34_01335 [Streptococcus agalactiae]HEN3143866.1 hypothetical protein [Streptococcus agalactiae]